MTIKLYKNYGCLSAEKRIVYTYSSPAGTAVCSDLITVSVPDDWTSYEGSMGDLIMVSPDGERHTVQELLEGNNYPYFAYYDRNGKLRRTRLKVVTE